MALMTDPQDQSSDPTLPGSRIDSVTNQNIGDYNDNPRILPRQVSSGALRGTQHVGYGEVKIDGSNNQIVIGNVTDSQGEQAETVLGFLGASSTGVQSFGLKVVDAKGGQLLIGVLPDGNLGIELLDASGNQVMRAGLLPASGIYGWATSTPGNTLTGQV